MGVLPRSSCAAPPRKNCVRAVQRLGSAPKVVGGHRDAPSVDELRTSVMLLGQRAAGWGTPDDIVQHHGARIMRPLAACEAEEPRA